MAIVGWIIFGLVVGIVAKLVTPGRDPGGFIVTILLGIAGAVLGGWLGQALGWYGPNEGAGGVRPPVIGRAGVAIRSTCSPLIWAERT